MLSNAKGTIRSKIMELGRRIVTQSGKWMVARTTDQQDLTQLLRHLHPVVPPQGLRRLGPASDGGYLVPNDLEGITACFSPGVGELSGFELDCAELGMRAHLADASVESAQFADDRLDFIPKFVRAIQDDQSVTLDEWVATTEPDVTDDLLLQIDIEGDEWGVFLGASSSLLKRFRIIVVELHDLQRLFDANAFPLLRLALDKILENHVCVHIHPNNCAPAVTFGNTTLPDVAEFTFLRNDRIDLGSATYATRFPHPLDVDSTTWNPPMALPGSLYRTS
ncbi:MAG: hypothetical protein F2520_10365 [Actinobacteria bacterium]|uniref:Unannotated protein n=1 Tax=freshwater metagenome TaxID=449393 RepID=A0A6J7JV21_9ZZZZ|nr:hypothetical protein [Actinomycetota bacterium]MTA78656.1 hypothetical protein [Actinomycetota bacterium]